MPETLEQTLKREGALAEGRALEIAGAIAEALELAKSRGDSPCEVQPCNVAFDADGRVVLAAVTTIEARELHASAYLAPEQERGETWDHRADMYALGVTLYESIAGMHPARGAIVSLDSASPGTRQLLRTLLALRPQDRFASYVELREAILRARVHTIAAPLTTRGFGLLIDYLAFGLIAAALAAASATLGALVSPLFAVLLGVAEAMFGVTLGKKLLRLRTIDARDSGRPRFGRCIARSLVKMSPLFAISLGLAVALPRGWVGSWMILTGVLLALPAFGRTRRALHDRIGRTRVVLAE